MKTYSTSHLLKHKERIYELITQPHHWNRVAAELLSISIIGLALFGIVMATFNPTAQHVLELSWKMIVLVWGSVVICTPSLYVFSAIRGSRLTLSQLSFLLVGTLATTGIVLLALTPITWFFTWTTYQVEFIQFMNVVVIAVSVLFGGYFLARGMLFAADMQKKEGQESNSAIDILLIWVLLFIVVLVQMAHALGPWYRL